jgi:Rps23 Pro-64 3,4-dihydroxylase Tpa1-like proline 4-hydroxylase
MRPTVMKTKTKRLQQKIPKNHLNCVKRQHLNSVKRQHQNSVKRQYLNSVKRQHLNSVRSLQNKINPKTSADMKNELDEKANSQSGIKCQENNLVEIEDSDDYLLHLEDILKRIHEAFYEDYDKMESGEVPDLKKVIPNG